MQQEFARELEDVSPRVCSVGVDALLLRKLKHSTDISNVFFLELEPARNRIGAARPVNRPLIITILNFKE